ncbi:MAG TPA: hypothetical protein VGN86_07900 [Pyrinomonadaceae bacterium]|nr:hypothetical protein [Pyrinomonadaceae bacterium]
MNQKIRRLLKFALISIAIVMCGLVGIAAFLGAFRTVAVTEAEEGPFYFAYREVDGNSLSDVGMITTALNNDLTVFGITNKRPFDVFQLPGSGSPNEIGFVMSEKDLKQLQQITTALKFRTIARQQYMKATFPFKSRLSFVIGYLKVNPAFAQHRKAHGYAPSLAMALDEPDEITYLQPVVRAN